MLSTPVTNCRDSAMEYRRLGQTSFRVSALGLGCNAFGTRTDEPAARAIIDRALDAGITLLDTAEMYGEGESERIVGAAVKGRRDKIVLSTKGGARIGDGPNQSGASRHRLIEAVEGSLRRLQTDYIDLYTVHFRDPDTTDDETLSTLDQLVSAGKIRYIGASNYTAWQVCRALWASERIAAVGFQAVQASYSLVDRTVETEMQPLCLDMGLGLLAFWPLGGGLLTGKYPPGAEAPAGSRVHTQPIFKRSFTLDRQHLARRLLQLAHSQETEPAALALAWTLSRPAVSCVLVGATKVEQFNQNLGALDINLTDEAVSELDALSSGSRWTPFR